MIPVSIRSRGPLLLAALAVFSAGAVAQKAPKPQPDKEVAAKVAELKKIAGDRKFSRDKEGVGVIDFLYQKHEAGMIDKDQALVVKALGNLLNKGKVRPADRTQLYVAAVAALGKHGKEGAKALRKAYENKNRFKAKPMWVPLREKMLLGVGKTKDESMVKFLLDEARRNPEAALQAAAGEALGNFDESSEKVRKEIFSSLMTRYGAIVEKASPIGTNIEAQNAQDRLAALQGSWNDTLGKLSGKSFDTFQEYQRWYNDNKSKKW